MDDFTSEELEQGRILFARPATFVMGCAKIEQLPDPDLPEVAFAGRSNVGKSSLIKAMSGAEIPDRGTVKIRTEVDNQHGEQVRWMESVGMFARRPVEIERG